jgi:phenylalanyl-tRNA synthetase beta chain
MPKIEVYKDSLFQYIGKTFNAEELEEVLTAAKAELDDWDDDEGILKIELNDTNRPDLWSTAGLGRQLRVYLGGDIPAYDFFSNSEKNKEVEDRRVIVDAGLKDIRPYIAAFGVSGKAIDEPMLKDLIQTQEKLCWNYGRKRSSIAMGVYRTDLMEYPVLYKAADPGETRFVPLGMEKSLSLREIIKEHPKGQEFGYIVENYDRFPFLTDSQDEVLSFPPVINSDRIGAVEIGDANLFIELTGTDLPSLLLTASIVACDLSDSGYTILPVRVEYPYDTPYGREIVTPYYFQESVDLDPAYASELLGEAVTAQEAGGFLRRMGCSNRESKGKLELIPPEYRNDFLHPVDVVEDIMIGRGMASFEPEMPSDFTVGRLSPEEEYSRHLKNILVGLGFQEMIFNYLGSKRDFIDRMNIDGNDLIKIANPMSENYEYVRNSILPHLLYAESVSGNAVYPHRVFEVGKTAHIDEKENYGSKTVNTLGFLSAEKEAGFNQINALVSAVFFYSSREYTLRDTADSRFISGRGAEIYSGENRVGVFGEIHPEVLENWGIQMPCTAGELDLDLLLGS